MIRKTLSVPVAEEQIPEKTNNLIESIIDFGHFFNVRQNSDLVISINSQSLSHLFLMKQRNWAMLSLWNTHFSTPVVHKNQLERF